MVDENDELHAMAKIFATSEDEPEDPWSACMDSIENRFCRDQLARLQDALDDLFDAIRSNDRRMAPYLEGTFSFALDAFNVNREARGYVNYLLLKHVASRAGDLVKESETQNPT